MPRKALGDRPLTAAERQAKQRKRNADRQFVVNATLNDILAAKTLLEAKRLAMSAIMINISVLDH